VLEDTALLPHWRPPENFPAAVCVPVSTPTTPLGTLWVFSRSKRDFSPEQTNLIEIVAGRIAADLEREMLIATGAELKDADKQIDVAARWQHDRLPSVTPLIEQFEVAGWTHQASGLGGDFHDWNVLPDGRLALAVADAQGRLVEAGLNAAALHAALKSHAGYRHSAADMLQRLNDTLWSASAGDQFASLAYALVHPDDAELELALAGGIAALWIAKGEPKILTTTLPPLGASPDTRYTHQRHTLMPGDFLVTLSPGVRSAVDEAGLRIGEAAIAATVQRHRRDTASEMLARLKRLLSRGGHDAPGDDLTLLILKRRPERK
jgi:phosphoserine phosphatase RsbU/P